eukprot:GHVU01030449.1.p1 GENE.GHVU01030449.1~~GHVU01030449.1.p1  ORF type:complete len:137 (+),score=2.49 GHVU01030449.1:413-823(+)
MALKQGRSPDLRAEGAPARRQRLLVVDSAVTDRDHVTSLGGTPMHGSTSMQRYYHARGNENNGNGMVEEHIHITQIARRDRLDICVAHSFLHPLMLLFVHSFINSLTHLLYARAHKASGMTHGIHRQSRIKNALRD